LHSVSHVGTLAGYKGEMADEEKGARRWNVLLVDGTARNWYIDQVRNFGGKGGSLLYE
jgi:hypothetical protein